MFKASSKVVLKTAKKKSCPISLEQLHALEAYRSYSDLGGEL